jgi:hypothetical protein
VSAGPYLRGSAYNPKPHLIPFRGQSDGECVAVCTYRGLGTRAFGRTPSEAMRKAHDVLVRFVAQAEARGHCSPFLRLPS